MRRALKRACFAVLVEHDERLLWRKQPSSSSEPARTTKDETSRVAGREQPFGAMNDTPFGSVFIPLIGVNRRSAIRCVAVPGSGGESLAEPGFEDRRPSEEPVVQQARTS